MLRTFDASIPEELRLSEFLDSVEIPAGEFQVGDEVWVFDNINGKRETYPVGGLSLRPSSSGFQGLAFAPHRSSCAPGLSIRSGSPGFKEKVLLEYLQPGTGSRRPSVACVSFGRNSRMPCSGQERLRRLRGRKDPPIGRCSAGWERRKRPSRSRSIQHGAVSPRSFCGL